MLTLVIEAATSACSVALLDGERIIAARHEILGRGHAERLVPMIAELPDRGRAPRILVSLGPGSFTGTRIGIATARALGIAWGAQVLGYPTLALVAAGARQQLGAVPVLVAASGGHGEWFVQPFDATGIATDDHRSLPPQEAVGCDIAVVAGAEAEALVAMRGWGQSLPLLPDARWLLHLPFGLLTPRLSPIYGRPPDARPTPMKGS